MNNLNRILRLIEATGDKFIVEDDAGNSFVIMNISQYEELVGEFGEYGASLSDDVIAKINQDISMWRRDHDEEILNEIEDPATEVVSEDKYYFEPED